MTVTDANRFPAVAAKGRSWAKVVVIDDVIVRPALDLNLQGRVNTGFAGKVTMVNTVRRATHVDEKLVLAGDDRSLRQPAVAPTHLNRRAIGFPFAD